MVVFALYSLQGSLGSFGAMVGVPLLLVVLLLGFYYMLYVNTRLKITNFLRVVNILVLLFTIYSIYYIVFDDRVYTLIKPLEYIEINKTTTLKNALLSFLPLYLYYWASKKNIIDEKWLKLFLLFWIIVSMISYIQYEIAGLQYKSTFGIETEELTNNKGFEFLTLFPFLLVVPLSFRTRYLLLSIFFVMVFSSFKRGTIIVMLIFFVIFIVHEFKSSAIKVKLRLMGLTTISLTFLFYYICNLFEESAYLQSRLEGTLEGNSSGRDRIYLTLWEYFIKKSDFIHQIFGHGTDYTVYVCGNFAHNDWLELLICYGIIGLCVFIYYFIALWHDCQHMYYKNYRVGMYMILIMFLFLSLFSMSYPNFSTSVFLGFCLGKINRRALKENNIGVPTFEDYKCIN